MVKKFVVVLLVVILLVFNVACSRNLSVDNQGASSQSIQMDNSDNTSDAGEALIPLIDRDWVSSLHNSTDDGVYIVQPNLSTASGVLYFIDSKTNSGVPVCSQVNCTHDNETCTAWLSYAPNPPVFVLNDRIYVVAQRRNDSKGELLPAALYEMELNGQGRKELFRLEMNQDFAASGIVGNEQYLFFNIFDIENATGEMKCFTYRYSFEEGKLENVYDCNGMADFIVGVLNDKIVAKHIEWNMDELDEESAYDRQEHSIYLLSQNGVREGDVVAKWQQDDLIDYYGDTILYLLDKNTGTLTARNLADNTEYSITDTRLKTDLSAYIVAVWDNGAVISINPSQTPQETIWYLYKDGLLLESQYWFQGREASFVKNRIVGSLKDQYLVKRNFDEPSYAFVNKSDF